MKNSNSFQVLELISINSLTTVKGGAAIAATSTRSVAGEWWGAGSL